jgi:hypothetical protein
MRLQFAEGLLDRIEVRRVFGKVAPTTSAAQATLQRDRLARQVLRETSGESQTQKESPEAGLGTSSNPVNARAGNLERLCLPPGNGPAGCLSLNRAPRCPTGSSTAPGRVEPALRLSATCVVLRLLTPP